MDNIKAALKALLEEHYVLSRFRLNFQTLCICRMRFFLRAISGQVRLLPPFSTTTVKLTH